MVERDINWSCTADIDSALDRLLQSEHYDRIAYLENSKSIEAAYTKAAKKGCSEAPSAHDKVDNSYICFVKASDELYELDGDMDGPLNRSCLAEDGDVLVSKELDVVRWCTDKKKDGTVGLLRYGRGLN